LNVKTINNEENQTADLFIEFGTVTDKAIQRPETTGYRVIE